MRTVTIWLLHLCVCVCVCLSVQLYLFYESQVNVYTAIKLCFLILKFDRFVLCSQVMTKFCTSKAIGSTYNTSDLKATNSRPPHNNNIL